MVKIQSLLGSLFFSAATFTSAQNPLGFFGEPLEGWSLGPLEGEQMAIGNGLFASPDGLYLYATISTGKMYVISTETSLQLYSFDPSGASGVCGSKVTYNEATNTVMYVVGDTATNSSTIYYGTHPVLSDDAFKAIGGIEGFAEKDVIAGTSGEFAYVTSNFEDRGRFYVFNMTNGSELFSAKSEDMDPFSVNNVTSSSWAAVAVSGTPVVDQRQTDNVNPDSDLVIFSRKQTPEPIDEENDALGQTYSFSLPLLELGLLNDVSWRSLAAPVMSTGGTELYFGASKSEYRGWNNDKRFSTGSSWSQKRLEQDRGDMKAPFSSPTFSFDESTLFVSVPFTTVGTIYALNAADGSIDWETSGTAGATVIAGIVVPENDEQIYFCDSADNGACYAVSSADGEVIYSIGAANVVGDITTSPDGSVLYIGSNGPTASPAAIIQSFAVAEMLTFSPTMAPTLSMMPSTMPSASSMPSEMPSMGPTKATTEFPSNSPSMVSSEMPTMMPTTSTPTPKPTGEPTLMPTMKPTMIPTTKPTEMPTTKPTEMPTTKPTEMPTTKPTEMPTRMPTEMPTRMPTEMPTTPLPTAATATTTGTPTAMPVVAAGDPQSDSVQEAETTSSSPVVSRSIILAGATTWIVASFLS